MKQKYVPRRQLHIKFFSNAAVDPHNTAYQAPNDGQSSIRMLKYIFSLSLLTSHQIDYLP